MAELHRRNSETTSLQAENLQDSDTPPMPQRFLQSERESSMRLSRIVNQLNEENEATSELDTIPLSQLSVQSDSTQEGSSQRLVQSNSTQGAAGGFSRRNRRYGNNLLDEETPTMPQRSIFLDSPTHIPAHGFEFESANEELGRRRNTQRFGYGDNMLDSGTPTMPQRGLSLPGASSVTVSGIGDESSNEPIAELHTFSQLPVQSNYTTAQSSIGGRRNQRYGNNLLDEDTPTMPQRSIFNPDGIASLMTTQGNGFAPRTRCFGRDDEALLDSDTPPMPQRPMGDTSFMNTMGNRFSRRTRYHDESLLESDYTPPMPERPLPVSSFSHQSVTVSEVGSDESDTETKTSPELLSLSNLMGVVMKPSMS